MCDGGGSGVLHGRWCQQPMLSSLVMVMCFAGGSGSLLVNNVSKVKI